MKFLMLCFLVVLSTGLLGCVDRTNAGPTDYDSLPGSGDHMASAPGLLSAHMGATDSDGLTLYSSARNNRVDHAASSRTNSLASRVPDGADVSTQTRGRSDYGEFRKFVEYEKFRALPENSKRKKAYRRWLKWRKWESKRIDRQ